MGTRQVAHGGQTCRYQKSKSLVIMVAHGGLIMRTRKVAQGARPVGHGSKSHLIMMAPRGRIMGTRKVAQRGQTCRLRKAIVKRLREANTVQQKEHDGA